MNIRSRLTAQNQVSIPADIRKKLGLTPGSSIEWTEEGGKVVVKRAGKHTSLDIHKAAFPGGPPKYIADARREGVRAYILKRYGHAKKRNARD